VIERERIGGHTEDRCDTGPLRWTAVVTPPK
jgi:hypothetical protein